MWQFAHTTARSDNRSLLALVVVPNFAARVVNDETADAETVAHATEVAPARLAAAVRSGLCPGA